MKPFLRYPEVVTQARPEISDTARWVAAMRALESARPDAHFHDPLAARLAGDVGRRMLDGIRGEWGNTAWPMITRTVIIDELVRRSLADGVERIVNLAAGFDTRPWRMGLPANLTWIEADLPALVEEKSAALAGERPTCRLRTEAVDLADPTQRSAFFDDALSGAARTLVLTEGLLIYLEPEKVRELGRALHERPAVAFWMHDLVSPAIRAMMVKSFTPHLGHTAAFRFAPESGVAFFEELGFRPVDVVPMMKRARELRRLPWRIRLFSYFPEADPRKPGKRPWSVVVRHSRG